ncbi:hypothetical protein CH063_14029, partial [Colletotrichum higginsianum]
VHLLFLTLRVLHLTVRTESKELPGNAVLGKPSRCSPIDRMGCAMAGPLGAAESIGCTVARLQSLVRSPIQTFE